MPSLRSKTKKQKQLSTPLLYHFIYLQCRLKPAPTWGAIFDSMNISFIASGEILASAAGTLRAHVRTLGLVVPFHSLCHCRHFYSLSLPYTLFPLHISQSIRVAQQQRNSGSSFLLRNSLSVQSFTSNESYSYSKCGNLTLIKIRRPEKAQSTYNVSTIIPASKL